MLRYFAKRIALGLVTIWFIASATFFGMHAVPGDPLAGDKAMTAQIRANLEAKYGLDKPLGSQYLIYLGNIARGDFGISYTQENRRVNDIIREHFPISATSGNIGHRLRWVGRRVMGGTHRSIPQSLARRGDYVLGYPGHFGTQLCGRCHQPVVLGWRLILPQALRFLPIGGWGAVWHMLVPALVLGLSTMAYLTRLCARRC